MKLPLDLSHRLFGRRQEAQYRPAVRLRNDFEYRCHARNILNTAYTCQGIYAWSGAPVANGGLEGYFVSKLQEVMERRALTRCSTVIDDPGYVQAPGPGERSPHFRYCSSLTCSIQLTTLPSSFS